MIIFNSIKVFLWKTKNALLSIKHFENKIDEMVKIAPSPPLVLAYHNFSEKPISDKYNVSQKQFENQILSLLEQGYTFLWQNEYKNYNKKTVIISIDDGWMDNYKYAFPILKKHKIKATINLTVESTINNNKDNFLSIKEINEMSESNLVTFDSHSMTHPQLTNCSDEELNHELIDSKRIIKEKLNIDSNIFVCPFEVADKRVINEIQKHYSMAYNYANDCEPLYSVRRIYAYEKTTKKDISISSYYHYLNYFRKHQNTDK